MKPFKRILLVWLFLISSSYADRLELDVDKEKLYVPFWQAKEKNYGAVILVKGGKNPQCSMLLKQFAQQLEHNGWSVLLLNCTNSPVQWINQLPEAISSLRQKDNKRIILVHYGDELNLALDYFNKPQSKLINGLVLISAYDMQKSPSQTVHLNFPVFDVVGQFDYQNVLSQRSQREDTLKDKTYLSLQIPGAHHDYQYSTPLLFSFIHGWMLKLPKTEPEVLPILHSYIEPNHFHPSSLPILPTFAFTD